MCNVNDNLKNKIEKLRVFLNEISLNLLIDKNERAPQMIRVSKEMDDLLNEYMLKKVDTEAVAKRIKNVDFDMHTDSLKGIEDYIYKDFESDTTSRNIISIIFNTIHEKNPEIEEHSKRVSQLCLKIGIAIGLSEAEVNKLKVSGLLHDIGKAAIDESILKKPGKLTEEEWNEIKCHSDIGYSIINISPEMSDIAQYVLSHHERYDGKGYPRGLKQEEIPLLARIIAVADSYDAMINERPYKEILTKDMAIEELIKGKGTQFDPDIVDAFIVKVLSEEIA